jgi:O-antigen/teichoic acid export membrane protein
MALSYVDKAVIFLLPIIVLFFFRDKTVYVSIEYIYSITIVLIPLIDVGLSTYFFYQYRNSNDHNKTVETFKNVFQRLYLVISFLGLFAILLNLFVFEYEKFIVFIVFRVLFVLVTTFLASYYRLINKPEKVVLITIVSNFISLSFLLFYFFFDYDFSLWLIFAGQILFSLFYFFKSFNLVFLVKQSTVSFNKIKTVLKGSVMFSWPTIIQIFLIMYITNYGKIHALTNMPIEDGVLLSLIQRFSMVIFLTHSSLLAYMVKSIYVEKNILGINKSILFKYLGLLIMTMIIVMLISGIYLVYNYDQDNVQRPIFIATLIIVQTFMSCVYAYLELNYGRENKNIIKLYLAIFGAVLFFSLLMFLKIDFLEKIAIAMFISTFASLLLSVTILYKRNYKLV